MRQRKSYVYYGDVARRRRRVKHLLLTGGAVVVTAIAIAIRTTAPADAEPDRGSFLSRWSDRKAYNDLQTTRGELAILKARYDRATQIIDYSSRYAITASMASSVFDASVAEGIDPNLGFRLVKYESDFNQRARSKVGAIGLTQLMPATARLIQRGVSNEALYSADLNLRVGFRYLRQLLATYHGNVHLALLAYNRGADAVSRDLRLGVNPANGYDLSVMKGYTGRGTID